MIPLLHLVRLVEYSYIRGSSTYSLKLYGMDCCTPDVRVWYCTLQTEALQGTVAEVRVLSRTLYISVLVAML